MPNIYWYCLLGALGLGVTGFTVYKKREIKLSTYFAFFLFSTCITWIGEFIVLGLFNSYTYKTGIYSSPWAQNILAHLILNSTFYPGTALLVAAYSLGYGSIILIMAVYLLMEYLFLKLGIYEHRWWRSYMTGVAIVIYQIFTKVWFTKINPIRNKVYRIVTLYFAGFVLLHYPIPIILLLGKGYYNVHWVQDLYLSSTLFIFSYQLVETVVMVYFVCILDKWYWKTVPFLIACVGQTILLNLGILVLKDNWNLSYTVLIYFLSIGIFLLVERHFRIS